MLTPCGYLARACLLRLLRRLEISMCSRPRVGTDARKSKRKGFSSDIDRGYNRVCRNGPRSRPSQPIAETFVQLPKTGNIAKAVPAKFVVSKNSRGGLQTSNLKPQLLQKSGLNPTPMWLKFICCNTTLCFQVVVMVLLLPARAGENCARDACHYGPRGARCNRGCRTTDAGMACCAASCGDLVWWTPCNSARKDSAHDRCGCASTPMSVDFL